MNPKNFWCKIEHLPFDFVPKLVLANENSQYGLIAIKDCAAALAAVNTMQQRVTWENKTVSWYCTGTNQTPFTQYNGSNTNYYYIVIS